MKDELKIMLVFFTLVILINFLFAGQSVDVKLRFFKAIKQGGVPVQSKVITSYTFTPFFTGNIISKAKVPDEKVELKKIFNVQDVELLIEADLRWDSSHGEKIFQVIHLNGSNYLILLSPSLMGKACRFRVEVYEGAQAQMQKNLMDAEVVVPDENIAVIGFLDSKENTYFLSFYVKGKAVGGVVGGVIGSVTGEVENVKVEVQEPAKVSKEIKPPKLIKKVEPIYPENCIKDKIEGTSILEVTTDVFGRVAAVKVLRSSHSDLDKAAINAVRQWVYEPTMKEGKPTPVIFTVTVTFTLRKEAPAKIAGEAKAPRLIKKVEPVYPENCKKEGIEGVVILEVTVNEKGSVANVKVVRSVHPDLDKAATDAVEKWKYEPTMKEGKPVSNVFPVTVTFKLKKEESNKDKFMSK